VKGERRVTQKALSYGFSLDRHVPGGHLLRKIDRFVDRGELRQGVERRHGRRARPR